MIRLEEQRCVVRKVGILLQSITPEQERRVPLLRRWHARITQTRTFTPFQIPDAEKETVQALLRSVQGEGRWEVAVPSNDADVVALLEEINSGRHPEAPIPGRVMCTVRGHGRYATVSVELVDTRGLFDLNIEADGEDADPKDGAVLKFLEARLPITPLTHRNAVFVFVSKHDQQGVDAPDVNGQPLTAGLRWVAKCAHSGYPEILQQAVLTVSIPSTHMDDDTFGDPKDATALAEEFGANLSEAMEYDGPVCPLLGVGADDGLQAIEMHSLNAFLARAFHGLALLRTRTVDAQCGLIGEMQRSSVFRRSLINCRKQFESAAKESATNLVARVSAHVRSLVASSNNHDLRGAMSRSGQWGHVDISGWITAAFGDVASALLSEALKQLRLTGVDVGVLDHATTTLEAAMERMVGSLTLQRSMSQCITWRWNSSLWFRDNRPSFYVHRKFSELVADELARWIDTGIEGTHARPVVTGRTPVDLVDPHQAVLDDVRAIIEKILSFLDGLGPEEDPVAKVAERICSSSRTSLESVPLSMGDADVAALSDKEFQELVVELLHNEQVVHLEVVVSDPSHTPRVRTLLTAPTNARAQVLTVRYMVDGLVNVDDWSHFVQDALPGADTTWPCLELVTVTFPDPAEQEARLAGAESYIGKLLERPVGSPVPLVDWNGLSMPEFELAHLRRLVAELSVSCTGTPVPKDAPRVALLMYAGESDGSIFELMFRLQSLQFEVLLMKLKSVEWFCTHIRPALEGKMPAGGPAVLFCCFSGHGAMIRNAPAMQCENKEILSAEYLYDVANRLNGHDQSLNVFVHNACMVNSGDLTVTTPGGGADILMPTNSMLLALAQPNAVGFGDMLERHLVLQLRPGRKLADALCAAQYSLMTEIRGQLPRLQASVLLFNRIHRTSYQYRRFFPVMITGIVGEVVL